MFGLLYPLGPGIFRVGLHLAALFGHQKARTAVTGRRGWAERLAVAANTAANEKPGPWIHVHCASLGGIRTGRPPARGTPGPGPGTPPPPDFLLPVRERSRAG